MFPQALLMSNSTSLSEEASVSSGSRIQNFGGAFNKHHPPPPPPPPPHDQPQKIKKKRSLPGNPDPDAEVIALSPKTLLATNRFVCEICNKGFQRDQNLQLHRRGHNLPWKLKTRSSTEVKKRAYVCPEPSCVHHNPSRALGDLTGIKKHFCRKHGEKKWKCDKCSKIYAVHSDWKAHSKTCGTREYRCDCGTLFSRKDSFITHRAFCDALAEESARISANHHQQTFQQNPLLQSLFLFPPQQQQQQNHNTNSWDPPSNRDHQNPNPNPNPSSSNNMIMIKPEIHHQNFHHNIPTNNNNMNMITSSPFRNLHVRMQPPLPFSPATSSAHLSATALLQKAATVGAAPITAPDQRVTGLGMDEFGGRLTHLNYMNKMGGFNSNNLNGSDRTLTRDFLGLTGDANGGGGGGAADVSMNVKDMLAYTGSVDFHRHLFKSQPSFGFLGTTAAPESWGNC